MIYSFITKNKVNKCGKIKLKNMLVPFLCILMPYIIFAGEAPMLSEMVKNKYTYEISFFVPCLNEEENVIPTIKTIQSALENFDFTYEIIIVDDNSEDKTYEVAKKYKTENPLLNINLIKHDKTIGMVSRSPILHSWPFNHRYCAGLWPHN